MILVRQTFKAKFGKGGELVALMKEGMDRLSGNGRQTMLLSDLSGSFDTIVTEAIYESMDEFFKLQQAMFEDPELRAAMGKTMGMIESGGREFYTVEKKM